VKRGYGIKGNYASDRTCAGSGQQAVRDPNRTDRRRFICPVCSRVILPTFGEVLARHDGTRSLDEELIRDRDLPEWLR